MKMRERFSKMHQDAAMAPTPPKQHPNLSLQQEIAACVVDCHVGVTGEEAMVASYNILTLVQKRTGTLLM